MNGKYEIQKKPIVIDAIQLSWDNWNEVREFVGVGKLIEGKEVKWQRNSGRKRYERFYIMAQII